MNGIEFPWLGGSQSPWGLSSSPLGSSYACLAGQIPWPCWFVGMLTAFPGPPQLFTTLLYNTQCEWDLSALPAQD